MGRRPDLDVAIIGAGPYGLSLAAHVAAHCVPFRIFGRAMATWRGHMPSNMLLKSDGFASSLSDPSHTATLKNYCAARNLPYDDYRVPVQLDRFIEYATWFQKRFVPNLEEVDAISIAQAGDNFSIELESGEVLMARRVVLATGLTWFSRIPNVLAHLPPKSYFAQLRPSPRRRFCWQEGRRHWSWCIGHRYGLAIC